MVIYLYPRKYCLEQFTQKKLSSFVISVKVKLIWVTIFRFHLQEINQIVCTMVAYQKKMNIENKDLLDWSLMRGGPFWKVPPIDLT